MCTMKATSHFFFQIEISFYQLYFQFAYQNLTYTIPLHNGFSINFYNAVEKKFKPHMSL